MRTRNSWTALALAATLLTGGAGTAGAQERRVRVEQGPAERQQRVEQELIFTRQHPETGVRVPVEPDVHLRSPLPGDTFVYLATEMSFDGKLVKGAPYSAEGVTESVQVLADGNRIVRKNTTQIYRDSEGRTRREHTLSTLGPWATAGEPTRTVSIFDPVAGYSYSLDPRSRTARKVKQMMRRPLNGLSFESGKLEVMSLDGKPLNITELKSTLPGRVVNRVDATHPAAAPSARGTVIVKIKVNAAGAVESAEALRRTEAGALRDAAVEAARRWTFQPGEPETAAISYKFDGRAAVAGELLKVFESVKTGGAKPGEKSEEHHITIVSSDTPNAETESLGKQMIEGVEAEGTRTVRTIPAGQIGNEQPIQIVSERWYSPELQVVVMTRSSDPRTGETTYRLTNINRAEPAATLFQVPSDYTVKEAAAPFVRSLRRPAPPAPAPAPPMMD